MISNHNLFQVRKLTILISSHSRSSLLKNNHSAAPKTNNYKKNLSDTGISDIFISDKFIIKQIKINYKEQWH